MESNKEMPGDVKEKIEILSTEDDKIKTIGELLSNESSRNMLKMLLDETMTANQIAQRVGISLPLVIYHLKKMQSLGIISVSTEQDDLKYYTSSKFAFIITSSKVSDRAKASKSLFNSLKRIYRFAAIGFAGLVSWMVLQGMQGTENAQNFAGVRIPANVTTSTQAAQPVPFGAHTLAPAVPVPNLAIEHSSYLTPVEPGLQHDIWIIAVPLVVIIAGLVIERILRACNR